MEKRFFKLAAEKLIEGILFLSGTVTSLTVVLMIVFLFREGIGLFGHVPMEQGNVLAVNKTNPVKKLSAGQLKHIFDQEITNWQDVGGKNDSIILFTENYLGKYFTDAQLGDT